MKNIIFEHLKEDITLICGGEKLNHRYKYRFFVSLNSRILLMNSRIKGNYFLFLWNKGGTTSFYTAKWKPELGNLLEQIWIESCKLRRANCQSILEHRAATLQSSHQKNIRFDCKFSNIVVVNDKGPFPRHKFWLFKNLLKSLTKPL